MPGVQDVLARVYDEGEGLRRVEVRRFQGDPSFVTALRFRFEQLVVTFSAIPDDDTIAAECGEGPPDADGAWGDVTDQSVWSECVGAHVAWAWCLTNQQGYTDGVRFEFELPGGQPSRTVELLVVASMFQTFVVSGC